jgi:hypothetical protein
MDKGCGERERRRGGIVAQHYAAVYHARMILAGVIGPASDGCEAREAPSANVQIWALDELACAGEFELVILGGCCGTDERYADALAWVSAAD